MQCKKQKRTIFSGWEPGFRCRCDLYRVFFLFFCTSRCVHVMSPTFMNIKVPDKANSCSFYVILCCSISPLSFFELVTLHLFFYYCFYTFHTLKLINKIFLKKTATTNTHHKRVKKISLGMEDAELRRCRSSFRRKTPPATCFEALRGLLHTISHLTALQHPAPSTPVQTPRIIAQMQQSVWVYILCMELSSH